MDMLVHLKEVSFPFLPYCLMQTNGGDKSRTNSSADHDVGTGAGEGVRTLDPNLGKVVLYH